MMFLLIVGLAFASPTPSADEERRLSAREAIIRMESEDGVRRSGVIDVAAPADEVFAAVTDLKARSGDAADVVIRSRTPTAMAATLNVDSLGYTAVINVRYDLDLRTHTCRFYLDPDMPSDISFLSGEFRVEPRGSGSRLYYDCQSDFPAFLPDRFKRWFAERTCTESLVKIRDLAEA